MKLKVLAVLACLLGVSSLSCSAPTRPVSATAPSRTGTSGSGVKTGVNISPVTRNQSKSTVTLQLAKDGKALLPIVISDKASDATKKVAAEMAEYLKRISGATFKVQTGDGSSGIVLGSIIEFPTPALGKALEISHGFEGKEAYAIRTRDKRLLLLGATDLGASHAAFRFLEELGARWFFPAKEWEVIPSTPDLKFNQDITDRPTFLSRTIYYNWGIFDDFGHPEKKSARQDYEDWKRHNNEAESFTVHAQHAYQDIIAQNQAIFNEHPEYLALVNGKRQGPQLELGNPAVRKLVVDYAISYFKIHPDEDMVSVGPSDGGGASQSDESKALGTPGEAAFGMANEVAVALRKAFPGQNKMVGMYAYNWHSDPPGFALEPNVYIQLTTSMNQGHLTFDELLREWPKKATNLGFYDYYSIWRWDQDNWTGGTVSRRGFLEDHFRKFAQANRESGAYATSVYAESGNNWGINGRGYYLANKLLWNPDVDVDAVLDDFYQKAFGAGASAMRDFYEVRDKNFLPDSPATRGYLFRCVDAASRATQGDAAIQARLDDIKNFLSYQYLYRLWSAEKDEAKKNELQNQIWTLVYRTRYSYMNHWEAIRQDWIHEPGMKPDTPRPWKVDKPMTHEETEALFQEGLKALPELHVPAETKFSSQVVPVDFGGQARISADTALWYQEGSRYMMWSLRGEPIKIHIHADKYYGFGQHAYEITDANGKVLKYDKPKLDETVQFEFKPPAPGLYFFDYNDHADMGQVYWQPDQIISMKTGERGYRAMRNIPDMYFYVPKGNKTIEYYFARENSQSGGPHQITDPNGNVTKITVDGDFISIPVPPGTDGKLWKIGGPTFGLGFFKFFNVPNYLSFSNGIVLLPQDVAQKDSLKIVK
jgi:hypothetical protein